MEDTEIRFESMPDFSSNSPTDDREYYSLFDELEEKCNPDRFMKPFVQQRFDLANELYAELQKMDKREDNSLKDIRDKAIDGLGIHISTNRLYKYLLEYCDPKIYTAMKPYDKEKVQEAGRLYAMIQEAKEDIHKLEAIENEASLFIKNRKDYLEKKEQEKEQEQLRKQEEEDVKLKREVRQSQFNMAKVIFLSIMFIGAYILCSGEGSIAIGITCIVGSICILVFFYLYVNKWQS